MTDPIPLDEPLLPVPPPRRRGGLLLLAVLALAAIIGVALYLLAEPAGHFITIHSARSPDADTPPPTPFDPDRAALSTQLDQLRQRVDTLEQRVAALSARPAAALPAAATPVATPSGDNAAVIALSARMDALAGRQDRLDQQAGSTGDRLKADEARLAAAGDQAAAVAALTDRAAKSARLQAAQAALAQGLPLGDIPGAPAALDRYRTDAPPTEAQLRLAFPAIAAVARAAARPDTVGLGFWAAMKARIQALITVRQGDRVLIGSSQAGLIDRARTALDAGDLAGASTILGGLSSKPAELFAGWRAEADGLLQARAALAKLAAGN